MKLSRSLACLGLVVSLGFGSTPAWAQEEAPASAAASHHKPVDPAKKKVGTVIQEAAMNLTPSLAAVATGKRITYVSTAPSGEHILVTGAVLTPRSRPAHHGKVVAWAHGTEGLADVCAPSRSGAMTSDPTFPLYAATVASYLEQGWTVAATDYQGLGSPGPHPYLSGPSEARGIIDSVRAARNLDRSLSKDYVAIGHSQGGQGALFAGEEASYDGNLRLRGVVGLAAASDLHLLAPAIAGTPGQGYLVMALYGLAALDPSVHPEQLLAPEALARVGVLENGCFLDIIGAFADLTADQLLKGGALPAEVTEKFIPNNPAQRPATVPVLLLQGTADETIPEFVADEILASYCSTGGTVAVKKYEGATHDTVLVAAQEDAVRWIADRFARMPAPSDCVSS